MTSAYYLMLQHYNQPIAVHFWPQRLADSRSLMKLNRLCLFELFEDARVCPLLIQPLYSLFMGHPMFWDLHPVMLLLWAASSWRGVVIETTDRQVFMPTVPAFSASAVRSVWLHLSASLILLGRVGRIGWGLVWPAPQLPSHHHITHGPSPIFPAQNSLYRTILHQAERGATSQTYSKS